MLNFNMGFTNYYMDFFYGSGMPAFRPLNNSFCSNSGFNSTFNPYSNYNSSSNYYQNYSNIFFYNCPLSSRSGGFNSSFNSFNSSFSNNFSSPKPETNNIFSYTPALSSSSYSSNTFKTNFTTPGQKPKESPSKPVLKISPDEAFNKALSFTFRAEGGYVNNPHDRGGATNMGMTQATYDGYRREKNLPPKSVTSLTKEEVSQIYYEKFWLGSGADKISDSKLAIAYYDAATLHGPAKAKEFYRNCGGDLNKFLDLRRAHFTKIVTNNPSQKVFHKGWNNRIDNLQNYLNSLA